MRFRPDGRAADRVRPAAIIDRFLDTFSRYIDSGFGLLQGEVAFLTATLIVIDMTIAGLVGHESHATGQGDDVIAKLLRRCSVSAFAYIIGNFGWRASCSARSPAELPLPARPSRWRTSFSRAGWRRPASTHRADSGTDRGHGWVPEVFVNIDLSWFCSSPGWW